jgi:predicted MFS family arabinose efflux permease
MMLGLVVASAVMPFLPRADTYGRMIATFLAQAGTLSMVVTPSLTYMAEAGARAGAASFGISYGLYNFAWGCGLLAGPAMGGAAYDWIGFSRTMWVWPLFLLATAVWFARASASDEGPLMQPSPLL